MRDDDPIPSDHRSDPVRVAFFAEIFRLDCLIQGGGNKHRRPWPTRT